MVIGLISDILEGKEEKVLKSYGDIYNSGVEPKVFLNEFLETLYFIKNINFINLGGSNFDLNDNEFERIKSLSKKLKKRFTFVMAVHSK